MQYLNVPFKYILEQIIRHKHIIMLRNNLFILISLLIFSCTDSQSQTDKTRFTATEFAEKIKQTDDAQILDVRTPEEYKGGHIANAKNINWNDDNFMEHAHALDKSKPVFVYCLSGGRSGAAAKALRKEGFKTVYEMPGGMMEWRSKNMPSTSAETAMKGMSTPQYNELL